MKIIITLIFFFVSTLNISSQTPTWHILPNSPSTNWRYDDLSFININTGWVVYNTIGGVNNGRVYKTTDGGLSWTLQLNVNNVYLRCIAFSDSITGWIGTLGDRDFLNPSPIMYKTINGGLNWDSVTFASDRPRGLCGLSVVDQNNIFACGRVDGPPYFIKTTNSGLNWLSQNMSQYASILIDCKFFSSDSGFVFGGVDTPIYQNTKDIILFTSDGGNSWIPRYISPNTNEICWKASFPNRNTGYVSLDNMFNDSVKFLKTTNAGLNWIRLSFPVLTQVYTQGIGFINQNTGWIGGDTNYTFKTTNGGFSWQADNFGRNINRIRFINDSIGYAVGSRIYKFTSEPIGIHPVSTEIPKQFTLFQNYPNPFNSETKIRFEIPSVNQRNAFDTKLIIYNALGQEIVTLVNEQLQPGVYEVNWDASDFPSGIYFYELKTDDFTQTKKLVLLK